jgi:perosamine synthetase
MDPDKRYFFVIPGSNYRITNIQAAILWGQLERLTEIYESRMNQETRYRMNLGGKILISSNSSSANRAPWLFTCRLPGMDLNRKLKLAHSLAERGIETRPVFYPLTCMPAFKKYSDGVNANTWLISSEGITLPTGSHVNDDTVDLISNLIIKETKD